MVGGEMTFKEELEEILNKELRILIELRDLSFKKTDIIISNNVQELEEITRLEEVLVNQMALLEEERERFLDTWGVAINTPISFVIEKFPEDNKILTNIKEEMTNIMEELSLRNKVNNDLIMENLDWVDFNMNLITSSPMSPNYGNKDVKENGNSIFDRKV